MQVGVCWCMYVYVHCRFIYTHIHVSIHLYIYIYIYIYIYKKKIMIYYRLLVTSFYWVKHKSSKYTCAQTQFSTESSKLSSASSTNATQNSEKERNVEKPREKVYWGTHACENPHFAQLSDPLISQSNLKLLSNIKDVDFLGYDELGKDSVCFVFVFKWQLNME